MTALITATFLLCQVLATGMASELRCPKDSIFEDGKCKCISPCPPSDCEIGYRPVEVSLSSLDTPGKCCPFYVCEPLEDSSLVDADEGLDRGSCIERSGMPRAAGERWQKDDDPCINCVCNEGHVVCQAMMCKSCGNQKPPEAGRCCPRCPALGNKSSIILRPKCEPLTNCDTLCNIGFRTDSTGCPICECVDVKGGEIMSTRVDGEPGPAACQEQGQAASLVDGGESAKTCRDLFISHPDTPSGEYWIDPNGGDASDKILVHCDAEERSTCIRPAVNQSQQITYVGKEQNVWLSEHEMGMQITYTADDHQINALQSLSRHAEQRVTYHCLKSVGYFDAQSQTYGRGLKLSAWIGVQLKPRGRQSLRYDVISDECQNRTNEWRDTVIAYRTSRPVLLPILDVALRDLGEPEKRAIIEVGDVCFS